MPLPVFGLFNLASALQTFKGADLQVFPRHSKNRACMTRRHKSRGVNIILSYHPANKNLLPPIFQNGRRGLLGGS